MTSSRALWPISAHDQSRPAPVSKGELTAYRGGAYPALWNPGTGGGGESIHPTTAFGHQSTGNTPMKFAIARRWVCKPRVLLDHELRIRRANRRLCHIFGISQRSLAGTRVNDWINVDVRALDRLRERIGNGSAPWHVILHLRLSGARVLAVSQTLQSMRSRHSGYLLISLAGLDELGQRPSRA